jgi:hypothetical protein
MVKLSEKVKREKREKKEKNKRMVSAGGGTEKGRRRFN